MSVIAKGNPLPIPSALLRRVQQDAGNTGTGGAMARFLYWCRGKPDCAAIIQAGPAALAAEIAAQRGCGAIHEQEVE